MLGIVLYELLRMAEQRFEAAAVERAATAADLASARTCQSSDPYSPSDLLRLVTHLSRETGTPVAELLRAHGEHLFDCLLRLNPDLFANIDSCVAVLGQLDSLFHKEICRRYPAAEPPRLFSAADEDSQRLTLMYRSPRALSDLALGLMIGCARHYHEPIIIAKEDLSEGEGVLVRFTLERWAAPSVALFQGVLERRS